MAPSVLLLLLQMTKAYSVNQTNQTITHPLQVVQIRILYFFYQEITTAAMLFFSISAEDWAYLHKKQHRNQVKTREWTNVMSKGIDTVQPYCSFAFKHHRVKPITSSKDTPLFTCFGYSMFDDCPVSVEVKVDSEKAIESNVDLPGRLCQTRL